MAKWQNILTAPKDGKYILAWFDEAKHHCILWWSASHWRFKGSDIVPVVNPTHWLPLPAPPNECDELEIINRAEYWEVQASMWHENYKSVMRFEREAEKYRDALERIAKGVHQGPRCHAIAHAALEGEKKDD